jgi:tungstate transport system substrate-binding protein
LAFLFLNLQLSFTLIDKSKHHRKDKTMKYTSRTFLLSLLLVLAIFMTACGASATPATAPVVEEPVATEAPATEAPTKVAAPANPNIILATTTSTQDSGLLDVLIPLFEAETGYTVQTVAVGSGQAMTMGQEGNADVLLVHAPASEKTFMEGGFGTDRFLVMHNDFILVGPAADPAGVKDKATTVEAFQVIFESSAEFITRGDDSGTHKKELELWKAAELDPAGQAWYIETGQGMGASMIVASEKAAYILTDRATYLANKDNYELEILLEGDSKLLNVYHVITVNAELWPKANYEGALAFANFMIAPSTQEVIGQFGVDKYGAPLFFPDADKTDADLGLE